MGTNPNIQNLVSYLKQQGDTACFRRTFALEYGIPLWSKATVLKQGSNTSMLVPLKDCDANFISGIWVFEVQNGKIRYSVARNEPCKPYYDKLKPFFKELEQDLFGIRNKDFTYSLVRGKLKGYATEVTEHCVMTCAGGDDSHINCSQHCWNSVDLVFEDGAYGSGGSTSDYGGDGNHNSGGPITPPTNPKPEPDPKVELDTSITKNPKLSCLWDKIMAVGIGKQNPLIINFLANFSNTFSTNNISIIAMPGLKSETSGQECYAKTDAKDINNIKIYLNSDYVNNRSSIEVALTLAHEVVHANLFRYYKNSKNNFYTMFADYIKMTKNEIFFDQHELMRQEYIPVLSTFHRQVASLNCLPDSNENYIMVVMGGVEKENIEIRSSIDIENYFRNNRGLNCK